MESTSKDRAGRWAQRPSKAVSGPPRGTRTPVRETRTQGAPADGARLPRGPQALPREQVAEHQRARLERAMVECVGEHGYAATTISELVSRAGISRRTFYERFRDKDECLLATYDTIIEHLGRRLREAQMGAGPQWSGQLEAFVRTLFDAAGDRPDAARLVCVEMGAAGPVGVRRWARGAQRLQRYLIDGFAGAPGPGTLPDPVARAMVGAVRRVLYTRVRGARSGQALRAELSELVPDLLAWIACYYPSPAGLPASPSPVPLDGASGQLGGRAPGTLAAPSLSGTRGLPRGEHRLPRGFVVHNQRERIFDAIANLTAANGYPALSVGEIAAQAAVSLETFYTHFEDKEDAFVATYETGHAHATAVVDRAFARQPDWIRSVRAGVEALLELLASEPSYAHVACVDVMVAYPHMAQRAHEANGFYAGLLDLRPDAPSQLPAPSLASEAIVAGVFELLHDYVLRGLTERLPELSDHVAYITLAPFMGAEQAWQAVTESR